MRAAERALRLDDEDRTEPPRGGDEPLAAEIARWEVRFAAFAALAPDVPPPARVWDRIEAAIDAGDAAPPQPNRRRRAWLVGGVIAAAAACLLLFVTIPATSPRTGVAVATIAGADTRVLARYDRRTGRMRVDVQAFGAGRGVPELWLLAPGREPVSLGQLPSRGPAEMDMPRHLRPLIDGSARLAITREVPSPTPHRVPSGDPIAQGRIIAA